jgi:protein-tyrosine phosphatase
MGCVPEPGVSVRVPPGARIRPPDRGLCNLRDVGGIPTRGDRRVPPGRLYRSDAPIAGDPDPELRPWPPRTVIDLRSPGEGLRGAHPLASARTRVMTVPLFRQLGPEQLARRASERPVDLATIYRRLLRASAFNLVRVIEVIADNPVPVLVHCAAGKDRTGVATALALAAVGVAPEAIVSDYRRTEASLDGLLERLARGWSEEQREAKLRRLTVERPELMQAPAAAIEAVLETLGQWPGGAAGWLLDHGLPPDALGQLRRRLTVRPRGSRAVTINQSFGMYSC